MPVQEAVPLSEGQSEDGKPGDLKRSVSFELLKKAAAVERRATWERKSWAQKSFSKVSKAASRVRVSRRPKKMLEATTTETFFKFVLQVEIVCVAYALVASFAPKPVGLLKKSGFIGCPRETLCATDVGAMVLIGIARGSAYFIYPGIMLVFATKCHALRTWLGKTFLSSYVPFHDLHALHASLGKVVAWGSLVHTVAHLVRWAQAGDLDLLYAHVTGRSGVAAIVAAPLVAVPMAVGRVKTRITFETRKTMHTVCSVAFGVALCCHAPATHIGAVVGSAVALYGLDLVYCMLFVTFKVDTTLFVRLEGGTQLTFPNPPGFVPAGCYAYINVPWIARDEWHAFSLYPAPNDPRGSTAICANVAGDWTSKLHKAVEVDTVRPCFVCGPFTSPFSTASAFDNLALVATGVGITPALAILHAFEQTRRVNIIWISRDASMVEFYLTTIDFDTDAFTCVYYTGNRKLRLGALPPNVLVFEGLRPDLELTLRTIIWGIETGNGLPEDMVETSEKVKRAGEAFASSLAADEASTDPMARTEAALRRALLASSVDDVQAQFFGDSRNQTCDAKEFATVLARFGAALSPEDAEVVINEIEAAEQDAALLSNDSTKQRPGLAHTVSQKNLRPFLRRTASSLEKTQHVREKASGSVSFKGLAAPIVGIDVPGPPIVGIDEPGPETAAKRPRRKSVDSLREWQTFHGVVPGSQPKPRPKRSRSRMSIDESTHGAESPQKSLDSSRYQRAFTCREDTMDIFSPRASALPGIDKETFLADCLPSGQLARWQVLYCGESGRVAETLENFGRDHHICFRQEKFDW